MAAALQGPVQGGPVRVGFIGVGGQGRSLLGNVDPAFADVRAMCDINPEQPEARPTRCCKKNAGPRRRTTPNGARCCRRRTSKR